jgi:serine/threonine-protein kinase
MKFVDDFLAQRRVQALRSARSLDEAELRRSQNELVAMGSSAITPLSECLSHAEARAPALEVLERLESDATIDAYVELLASANPVVVSAVSRLLTASRRYDARRILRALEATSPSKSVLEPILREQIAFIPAADVAATLPKLPRDGQVLLLKVIERAAEGVVVLLLPLLRHEDPWLRANLAKLLSSQRGPGVVPALAGLLRDGVKAVRLEAVTALHALDARDAVPDLIGALEDTDLQVQSAAIDALRDLGDDQAVPRLVQVLTHESEYVRRGAVEVLNEVATPEAIQDLVRVLGDADWWVRVRAADALGALGGEKVVRAVAGLMKDVDDSIRRHAARTPPCRRHPR